MALSNQGIEEAGMGHNSLSAKDLELVLTKVEALVEERRGINADIREIMAEAKSKGYDTTTIRDVLKFRATDADVRKEREELRDLYLSALGLM